MSRWLTSLVVRLPGKAFWDRVQPWLVLIAAVVGAIWSLMLYRSNIDINRANATFNLYGQYRANLAQDKSGAIAFDRFEGILLEISRNQRCIHFRDVTDTPIDCAALTDTDQEAINERMRQNTDSDRSALRQAIGLEARAWFAALSVDDRQQAAEIRQFALAKLAYLDGLATCGRHRQCDPDIVLALVEHDIIGFLSAACHLFTRNQPSGDAALRLAEFVRAHRGTGRPGYSSDAGRRQQFFCDWLRVPVR